MSTYTPIASVTLSSAQATVDFVGIPQTYTDLVLVVSAGNASSGPSVQVRFNGDTASNYSWTTLSGGGTSALSDKNSSQTSAILSYFGVPYTTLGAQTQITHLMNYANTAVNKVFLTRASNHQFGTDALVGLWRSNSAITSINLYNSNSTNFVAGSTFNLYGIADAAITNVAKATGGDSVYTDGTYWYHTFLSSGTFTPTQPLTADYLVVAGGGGGGHESFATGTGGGGGAGGVRCTVGATGGGGALESPLSLLAQAYTVTIGAGGATSPLYAGNGAAGGNGSNSVFASITSSGGGGGGGGSNSGNVAVGNGGSGGGGGAASQAGGTGTAGQGFAGGAQQSGSIPTAYNGGGGGGAAEAGNTDGLGQGGDGIQTSISGVATYYGGGGGGASYGGSGKFARIGGLGGGGNGAVGGNTSAPVVGEANTGGGGGGMINEDVWGVTNGGSGIVIVRYAV